jgi:hypothetical protein
MALSGVGQYKTVDPAFVRDAKAEADAIKRGMTAAYIEERGGVNASGYYGDSWSSTKNLTPAEYDAAIVGKSGAAVGQAINAATSAKSGASSGAVSTNATGTVIAPKTAEQLAAEALAAGKTADRKSAYDLLYEQFNKYGLSSLVEPLKNLITDPGVSPSEFTIRLRESDPYKQRFGANTQRIAKGLRSLNEAEYIGLEDQYQNIMRNYGLPDTYYTKGDLGRQPGFEKFIAGDVSPVELESRIQTAQNRVIKANPEISAALKQFYPDISSGDILAYVLDPTNALENIKRKVSAAEIGGAALRSGLSTDVTRAEQLVGYGITKQMAEQGYGTIGGGLQRGSELASMYGQLAYDQKTAEQEVFNLAGGTEAARERRKLTGLEKATFGGTTGMSSSALSRERAGQY